MIDKEQLLKISNLNLSGKLEQMNEEELAAFAETLNLFVGGFPVQEEKLKTELAAKDYTNCRTSLLDICETLKKIHAEFLAEDCTRHADSLNSGEHEKNVAYITNFLAAVSALSIDIQMAMYKAQHAEAPAEENPEEPHGGKYSILAVDDVVFFLSTLKSFLKDTTCKLTCVTSGEAALRFLRDHNPDLFLLDIDMPEMNGYELARKIREIGQKAPIMFLTGNAAKSYVIKAIEVGAADFIIKPINKEQLLEKVGRFLKLESPSEENS
ncbi:MAG: response regulator [Oscillospiraceae bacterium]|nr:response regulator [Oscillospiraceae bacterium]